MREATKSLVSGGVFARETMPVGLGILAGTGEKGWIVNRYSVHSIDHASGIRHVYADLDLTFYIEADP